jgi:hypothetical protein
MVAAVAPIAAAAAQTGAAIARTGALAARTGEVTTGVFGARSAIAAGAATRARTSIGEIAVAGWLTGCLGRRS